VDAFEKLYAVATGPGDVLAKTRAIIGQDQLALALAKFTTMTVSSSEVANVLRAADNRIPGEILKTKGSSCQR
jgi:hypothetical protein